MATAARQQTIRHAPPAQARAVAGRIYGNGGNGRTQQARQPRTISPERAARPKVPRSETARPALTPERMQQERDAALREADSVSMLHAEAATVAWLSAAEERVLIARAQAGDVTSEAAREQLVKAFLGLVSQVAHYYRNAPHDASLDLDDLIAEGLVGLLRAIKGFDLTTPWRFSTYATWWIRQAITRALVNTGHAIRVPVRMYERQHALLRDLIAARDAVMCGDLPAGAFLADGQPGPLLLARLAQKQGMTAAEGAEALRLAYTARDLISLDQTRPLDSSGDTFTLAETLEAEDTDTLLAAAEERADLAALLAPGGCDATGAGQESVLAAARRILARREAYRRGDRDVARELAIVFRRALAPEGERPPLRELADEYGCSRERIRQLEAAGLELLRREYLRANPSVRAKQTKQAKRAKSGQEGGAA